MAVDVVLGAAPVRPLARVDLIHLRHGPGGFESLSMMPQVDPAVQLGHDVGLNTGVTGDWEHGTGESWKLAKEEEKGW